MSKKQVHVTSDDILHRLAEYVVYVHGQPGINITSVLGDLALLCKAGERTKESFLDQCGKVWDECELLGVQLQ